MNYVNLEMLLVSKAALEVAGASVRWRAIHHGHAPV